MKKGHFVVALCVEALGIWVVIGSCRIGVQTLSKPGPGAYPLLLGALLCILGIPLIVTGWKTYRTAGGPDKATEGAARGARTLIKPAIVIASLLGYALLLEPLGFPIVTFLFLFVLFLMGYPGRWVRISLSSIVLVVLCYVIFTTLLQVPFPMGILQR